ncbi:hypothetical protein A2801_02795 [Candidatus Woesebacteria bacterium RIFCSPHIGHO2_01_FULL_41_10]|uniref:Type 4 fimbrial biogenesis protein PilX N-terminal domain-containing protein n=1 Tax=Candidatus Woesebacteria bacterium RIFCSPHIGHO2_01_FULL_41_10 TaxID=1802500 RepID=A0A1F7YNG5_9BACT|nr:MAG: hypothetical protein A2801_02795 [Candidatus Woesebacteria bacterium RIFCSPHIGHO2_01_FULL_41_10]
MKNTQSGQALLTQSGQALLIVLLAMATIATVALSIVSRSITDVSVTTDEEDSLRAFSAAEAGIEEALTSDVFVGSDVVDKTLTSESGGGGDIIAQVNVDIAAFPQNSREYAYPIDLASGDYATVWLVSRDDEQIFACSATNPCYTGNLLRLCWGKSGTSGSTSVTPALETTMIYEDALGVNVRRQAYDPNSSRGNGYQSATVGSCTVAGVTYAFFANLNLASLGLPWSTPGGLKAIQVRMLYNTDQDHPFGIIGQGSSTDFPTQGRRVDSEGVAGASTRRIEAFLLHPEVPPYFNNAVFSNQSITKP